MSLLPAAWRLLDICPEQDLGMGVPRPAIAQVESGALRLREVESGRDWTRPMDEWCRFFTRILLRDGVAGAVLKARSPSCGRGDVEVLTGPPASRLARHDGDGFWVRALRLCEPAFPLINDEELADPTRRTSFLAAAQAWHDSHPPRP